MKVVRLTFVKCAEQMEKWVPIFAVGTLKVSLLDKLGDEIKIQQIEIYHDALSYCDCIFPGEETNYREIKSISNPIEVPMGVLKAQDLRDIDKVVVEVKITKAD